MLIVQVVHGMKTKAPSYVLGIDKATGKTRWRVGTNFAQRAPGERGLP